MPDPRIIILQLNRMGDLLQTVPLLMGLRAQDPSASIEVVCVKEFGAALQSLDPPVTIVAVPAAQVSAVRSDVSSGITPLLRVCKPDESCDACINCNHDEGAARLAAAIPATRRSGRRHHPPTELFVEDAWGRYLFALARGRTTNLFNMADIYAGMGGVQPARRPAQLSVSDSARADAISLLTNRGWRGTRPLLGLQLGTNAGYRSWRIEEFSELASRMHTSGVCEIVITGGPDDDALADEFCRVVKFPIVNCVGATSLAILPALLAHCDLLITNDTGPMHSAALAGVRTLSLHCASAYFAETAPWAAGAIVVHADLPCYPCFPSACCEHMACKTAITPYIVAQIAADMLADTIPAAWDFPGVGIYETAFLTNGRLGYLPRTRALPRQFVEGFAWRIAWERMLGIATDEVYVTQTLARYPAHDLCETIASVKQDIIHFASRIHDCEEHYARLHALLSAPAPDSSRIKTIFDGIRRIESEFNDAQEQPMVFFHMLEVGAQELPDIRQTIAGLHRVYRERSAQLNAAIAALGGVIP
jgi:ADP-heptose:LPS heptosyltransferase